MFKWYHFGTYCNLSTSNVHVSYVEYTGRIQGVEYTGQAYCLWIYHITNLWLISYKRIDFSRSSRPEVFCKKGVLENFTKFTEKHLCQSLFFKKETLTQVFSCEFYEIFKNIFFDRTPLASASVFYVTDPSLLSNKLVIL